MERITRKLMKYNDLIHTVEKLRAKGALKILKHHGANIRISACPRLILRCKSKRSAFLGDGLGADIGRHDDDRVSKVHFSAERIGQAAILHHLQEEIKDILVCFFNLVEQHNGIRLSPNRFRELTAEVRALQKDIEDLLNDFKTGFDTPAGKKFYNSCANGLLTPINEQVIVIEHIADNLMQAKNIYAPVFDGYRDLVRQLSE